MNSIVNRGFVAAAFVAALSSGARAVDKQAYLMVYHKDADHSLHMSVSDDSYNWRAVYGDKAVVKGADIAVQKGIRDPHIACSPDGVYVIAATDLHIFARQHGYRTTEWERDGKKYGWGNNRGLVLLKSRDLVNWEKVNLDFSTLTCKTGATDAEGNEIPWSEVGCTWAPELVWDDSAGAFFMHFTTRFGRGMNQIYAVHLNRALTGLAEDPFPLYSAPRDEKGLPRYNIIDSDMVRDDAGRWHLFYVSHARGAAIRHVTGEKITGPFVDAPYFDGERNGHEAPSCWRRPDGTWVVMWDRYTMNPHNFGFVETTDFQNWKPIGYFDGGNCPMKRTGFSEQKHGGIVAAPADLVHAMERHFADRLAQEAEALTIDGSNPLIKTRFTADPAGYSDGEWFYVFMGHDDDHARGYTMFDWSVIRTKDMKTWEDLGSVMSVRGTFPWARRDKAWASQAVKRNGKWYWYVATSRAKGHGDAIAVAVADDVKGPWTDPLGKPMCEGRGFIDPSVIVDDDGKAYLFWGNHGGDPGLWYAELKDNMIEFEGEIKPVPGLLDPAAFGAPLRWPNNCGNHRRGSPQTNFVEAPWIYKVGDTYYLEYASGGLPEKWSYSTAKSIHGPWTFGGKIMDNAGNTHTIHGGSVQHKGEWYMLYHDGNAPGGGDKRRSVRIERYTRNPDGAIPFIIPTLKGVM